MPELPIAGGICLIGEPAQLTQQEAARNRVAWPWWERLRRRCVKHRYQAHLLKQVRRGDLPWLVVYREPDSGGFTGWRARSK